MAERRNDNKKEPWRDPSAQAYVQIENVTKRFGDFVAVNNVSLKIYQHEIFCLLGARAARRRCCGCSPASSHDFRRI